MAVDGWIETTLGNIVCFEYGKPLPTKDRIDGSYPVFGSNGVVGNHIDHYVSGPGIIIGRKGTAGSVCWADESFWPIDTTYFIKSISPSNSKYLYYLLTSINLSELSSTTGVPGLNRNDAYQVNVLIPPLSEQKKIAEILGSVDEAIAKTEAVIAQTQRVKQGLLQTLLTRGIGHTKFKQTELGEIPESWEVVSLDCSGINIIDGDRGKNYPKQDDFTNSGYCLFLSATNVTKNGFVFNSCSFIAKDKDEALRKGKLKRQDIVLTTRGTVGNMAFYSNDIPYEHIRINSGMVILRNTSSDWSTEYVYNILREWLLDWQYKKASSGSAQPQLPIKDLKKFKLIKPSYSEQVKINDIIQGINEIIGINYNDLTKLKQLKKGLMADLLSGRVRVDIVISREEAA